MNLTAIVLSLIGIIFSSMSLGMSIMSIVDHYYYKYHNKDEKEKEK